MSRKIVTLLDGQDVFSKGVNFRKSMWVFLEIRSLRIDPQYQRNLNMGKVEAIDRNFDESLLGVFKVSSRTGNFNICDAQHRFRAIERRISRGELPENYAVLCEVRKCKTVQEEAAWFEGSNSFVTPVTGNDRFKARIVQGKTPEYDIQQIIHKYGYNLLFLNPGQSGLEHYDGNGIRGCAKLLKAYSRYGADRFEDGLRLLDLAFKGKIPWKYRKGDFIGGVVHFLGAQIRAGRQYNERDIQSWAKKIPDLALADYDDEARAIYSEGRAKYIGECFLQAFNPLQRAA